MVLISIRENGYEGVKKALSLTQAAEIRLDYCGLEKSQISELFSGDKLLIATCRPSAQISEDETYELMLAAIEGISKSKVKENKYIDLDINSSAAIIGSLSHLLNETGGKLILSYHNFEETPHSGEMERIAKEMLQEADIAKLAVMANSTQDAAAVMNLYKRFPSGRLAAFCMGKAGKFTRRMCLELGAPFSYSSLNGESETAPGQYTFKELSIIADPSNFKYKFSINRILPELWAPASKSHAQRAIVAASLSKGTTTLKNYSNCNDTVAAINLFANLGVIITADTGKRDLRIESPGFEEIVSFLNSKKTGEIEFFTGESGLLTRLVTPLAAVLARKTGKNVVISGEGTILNREFTESEEVLHQLGCKVESVKGKLPLKIISSGNFSNTIKVPGREGSQLISGLLMSLPLLNDHFSIEVGKPSSTPYIDTTLSVLECFGITTQNLSYKGYSIFAGSRYSSPGEVQMEGDWSSASALLVAGAIKGGTIIKNLKIGSGQADEKITAVLEWAGAAIKYDENNCSVKVMPCNNLRAFEFDATQSPDLFPSLAALAVNCEGTSRIKGVGRLYNKESNRAEAIFSEYTKLGASIEISGDTMTITGTSLKGGRCFSYNDHRIAMSLAVASINSTGEIYIDEIDCTAKSFPAFIDCFSKN